MQAIKAVGESGIYFKLEIIKKVIELIVLLITMWISVEAMVVGMAICTTLFTVFNAYPNIKLIDYTLKEQLKDILPSISMSAVMFVVVYAMQNLPLTVFSLLILQVITGTVIYITLSAITNNKEFAFLLKLLNINKQKHSRLTDKHI